jgi:two-component system NtrC family sensor kinase
MRSLVHGLTLQNTRRWRISLPFVIAVASLIYVGWAGARGLTYPHDGITGMHGTGLINEMDSFGPASDQIHVGDILISVDGVPVQEAMPFYPNKRSGDEVNFVIERNKELIPVTITLIDPPTEEILGRLTPLFVALIFWGIGVFVQTLAPAGEATTLFFLFSQNVALMLASGLMSLIGPAWTSELFNFLFWLIGPLTVHFHLHFPQMSSIRGKKYILGLLYTVAALGSLPYLIWGPIVVSAQPWYTQIVSAARLFVAVNLFIVIGLLFHAYRHTSSPGVRGKIRIVVLGGLLSALPLITLNFLPDALLQQPIIPNSFAFLLLGIIPLTYGYAIFRHRLIEIEKHVNRGATFILVYSILGAFYLILYVILHQLVPQNLINESLINTVLVLVLATVFVPLHQRVQHLADTVFYGGWYDYRSAITEITQGLEQVTELHALARSIGDRLVRTLRLDDACIFLRDLDGDFSILDVAPHNIIRERPQISVPALPKSSLTYLLKMGAVERNTLRETLSQVELTPEERQLLNTEQVHLWIPVVGHGQVLGLLALGPKFGGDIFSGEDMDILRVVARQIAPLIENIHLVTRLKRHAANLERRVAERTEELHAAKERVEAILSSVGDGVVVTDLNWNVITVNAAFEEQYGFLASQIIGRKVWSFVNVGQDNGILDDIVMRLRNGSVWSGELINYRKDMSPFDVQLTIAPVRDQSDQVMGYVGSQRDITRNKQLDRLKDRLIFDVSHELRTPVTNLNLYVELLENGRPEKRKDYLSVLKGETKRLIDLIESILDLSRLDMWKSKKVRFSAVDLNLIAEQVVDAHQPLAESAGLELNYFLDASLPPIRGEPNQLARLITNMLANAIRYTPSGQVTLRTFRESREVRMQVSDTGIGIEREDLPHLFDRFYRGQQVSQSKITGTGLGLAIVKEIVEIHEGRIEVKSEVGKGSEFNVWLPIYTGETWQEKPFL